MRRPWPALGRSAIGKKVLNIEYLFLLVLFVGKLPKEMPVPLHEICSREDEGKNYHVQMYPLAAGLWG